MSVFIVLFAKATDARGHPIDAGLVLSTNYDGPESEHVKEIVRIGGKGLEQLYQHCVGYMAGEDLYTYLMRHRQPYAAFFVGTPGRSLAQIRAEAALRERLETYLDQQMQGGQWAGKDAAFIRQQLTHSFFELYPEFKWAISPSPKPSWGQRLQSILLLIVAGLLTLVVLPVLLIWVFVLLPLLFELWDREMTTQGDYDHARELARREDREDIVQNQMTHLVNIKPGWLRPATLRLVLWGINLLARHLFTKGKLGSIPTIHFARWVIIDQGRRLLFFSNYDGSWESYLGDFIDKASVGLTPIWSNTVLFPKTRFLLFKGSRNEQLFKSWTRDHQIITNVWYSPYRNLTVSNINNNSKIRDGFSEELQGAALETWLRRL
jgi:hypothetical protein